MTTKKIDFDALDVDIPARKFRDNALNPREWGRAETLAFKALTRLHPEDWEAAREWAAERIVAQWKRGKRGAK